MICDTDKTLHEALQAREGKKYEIHFIVTKTDGCFQTREKDLQPRKKKTREERCLETLSGSVDYHTLESHPFYPSVQVFWSQMVKPITEASDFGASWEELAGFHF